MMFQLPNQVVKSGKFQSSQGMRQNVTNLKTNTDTDMLFVLLCLQFQVLSHSTKK